MQLTLKFKPRHRIRNGQRLGISWRGNANRDRAVQKKIIDREDGKLTGYLNGAGFLSYYEPEMMLKTLGQLV